MRFALAMMQCYGHANKAPLTERSVAEEPLILR